jgi:hypothetical protein
MFSGFWTEHRRSGDEENKALQSYIDRRKGDAGITATDL